MVFTGTLINYHFFVNTNTTAMFRIAFSLALSRGIFYGLKSGLAKWGLVLLLSLLGMMSVVSSVSAQRVMTNRGIDFWFGYMNNNISVRDPLELGIYLSFTSNDPNKKSTSATIRVPGKNFERKITVPVNVVTEYRFDRDPASVQARITDFLEEANSNIIDRKSVHISADDSINVSISNRRPFTFDITTVYHSGVIGSNYIVGAYNERFTDGTPSKSQFMIVAKYDTTIVEITPTADIIDDGPDGIRRRAGVKYTLTLNQGDTYLAMSNGDLTGTIVEVPKSPNGITERCTPFALFGGNQCSNVGNNHSCDHLLEQMLPLPNLDNPLERSREFIVYGTKERPEDVFYFVALTDEPTTVSVYDRQTPTNYTIPTGKGKFRRQALTTAANNQAFFIEANNPIALYMYVLGDGADGNPNDNNADPSMVTIPPIEMMRRDTGLFIIANYPRNPGGENIMWRHFVNVYCRKADTANLQLKFPNGDTYRLEELVRRGVFSTTKTNVIGNNEFVVYNFELGDAAIDRGSYMITSTQGLMTISYGTTFDDSYSYVSNLSFIATPNVETRIATKKDLPCEDEPKGEAWFKGIGGLPYEYTDAEGKKGTYYRVTLKKQNPTDVNDTLHVGELRTFDPKDYSKQIFIKDIKGYIEIQDNIQRPCKDTVMTYLGLRSGDYLAVVNQYKGCEQYHRFNIGSLPPLKIRERDTICRFATSALIADSVMNQSIWWCTEPPGLTVDSSVVDGRKQYFIPLNQPAIQDNSDLDSVIISAYRKRFDGVGTYGDCENMDACVKTMVLYFSNEPKAEILLRTDPGKGNGDTLYVPQPTGFFSPEVLVDKLSAGYLRPDSSDKAKLIYKWDFGVENIENDTSRKESDAWTYPEDNKGDEVKSYEVTLTVMEKEAEGCSVVVKKRVYVIIPRNYMIKVPNVFTPNGDGYNDKVILENFGIEKFEMVIYDRWGMEVFRGQDINNGWDGKVNSGSKDASDGQYFWVIQATTVTDLEITRTGSITLLR